MTRTLQSRAIAGELANARSTARRLFGVDYPAKVGPWKECVRNFAAHFGCRPIHVPLRLQKDGALPASPLLLFAAVVEVIEEGGR